MATFNLDELLVLNSDSNTYSDDQPNTGIPQATFAQDHFAGPVLKTFYKTIRGTDCYNRFNVGGWEAGNFHRKECYGPRVDGPHAYMIQHATVISAHKQAPREEILVEMGDTVIIRGTEYAITRGRYNEMSLEPIK